MTDRIFYRKGYKYQLAAPYQIDLSSYEIHLSLEYAAKSGNSWVSLDTDGVLSIAEAYAWNGSNWSRDTRKSMRGSLIHDALYQLIRIGALPRSSRPVVDQVYYDILREDGTWRPRAELRLTALGHFGEPAAHGPPRPVLVAP